MFYRVIATIVRVTEEGRTMVQMPTFFLDRDMQGIESSEHAARIAASVVDPYHNLAMVTISVCQDSDDGDYYTNTYGGI